MTDSKHGGAADAETSGSGCGSGPGAADDGGSQLGGGAAAPARPAVGAGGARARGDGGRPERLGTPFLDGGSASLTSRPRDARDETVDRLRTKVGELTMDTELLQTKIARLGAGGAPVAVRRSKQ